MHQCKLCSSPFGIGKIAVQHEHGYICFRCYRSLQMETGNLEFILTWLFGFILGLAIGGL